MAVLHHQNVSGTNHNSAHISFLFLSLYSTSFITKEAVVIWWSRNHLPLNPTWELFPTWVIFHITAANTLQEAVCRKTTMSNNTVIIQSDPTMSPLPLGSHSISLVFPAASQTSPVICGVRALQQVLITVAKFHMREMQRESPFNLTLHRPNIALTFKIVKLKFQPLWTHLKNG